MTQFSPRSFLLKTEVQGLYLRLASQLATPPGFHATHITKGNLVVYTYCSLWRGLLLNKKQIKLFEVVTHVQGPASQAVLSRMQLTLRAHAQHLKALRAWRRQCLPGR